MNALKKHILLQTRANKRTYIGQIRVLSFLSLCDQFRRSLHPFLSLKCSHYDWFLLFGGIDFPAFMKCNRSWLILPRSFKAHNTQLNLFHEMDHLACFVPGMLALDGPSLLLFTLSFAGGIYFHWSKGSIIILILPRNLWKRAIFFTNIQQLVRSIEVHFSSYISYLIFFLSCLIGLSPEIVEFSPTHPISDFTAKSGATHSLLRPGISILRLWRSSVDVFTLFYCLETLESLFLLYRVTGDEKYREWAWDIFLALERIAKTKVPTFFSPSRLLPYLVVE